MCHESTQEHPGMSNIMPVARTVATSSEHKKTVVLNLFQTCSQRSGENMSVAKHSRDEFGSITKDADLSSLAFIAISHPSFVVFFHLSSHSPQIASLSLSLIRLLLPLFGGIDAERKVCCHR